jgi:hypothetical protein
MLGFKTEEHYTVEWIEHMSWQWKNGNRTKHFQWQVNEILK